MFNQNCFVMCNIVFFIFNCDLEGKLKILLTILRDYQNLQTISG